MAGSYAIEASLRAGGLAGGYNSVQVGVPVGDVVVAGVVTLALFGAGVEVHPPDAAMHRIAIARTACQHSDRGAGCERHPPDERPALGCAAVITPSSTRPYSQQVPTPAWLIDRTSMTPNVHLALRRASRNAHWQAEIIGARLTSPSCARLTL